MATDLVSLIIAIVALVGSLGNAALVVWERRYSERRRRYHALADVVAKYRDPLHLAAEDLSSKIFNIIDNDFAWWVSEAAGRPRQEYAMLHTSFVLGRFFCWLYILRRDTQFLLPSTHYDERSAALKTILNKVCMTLRTSRDDSLFKILSGEQEAIGELMTLMNETADLEDEESNLGKRKIQCRCMGYASFVQRWKRDPEFREWFGSIVNGLKEMNRLSQGVRTGARFPRHPRGLHRKSVRRCNPARGCLCTACRGGHPHEREFLSSSGKIQEKSIGERVGDNTNAFDVV